MSAAASIERCRTRGRLLPYQLRSLGASCSDHPDLVSLHFLHEPGTLSVIAYGRHGVGRHEPGPGVFSVVKTST